jgi:hypothetical protein
MVHSIQHILGPDHQPLYVRLHLTVRSTIEHPRGLVMPRMARMASSESIYLSLLRVWSSTQYTVSTCIQCISPSKEMFPAPITTLRWCDGDLYIFKRTDPTPKCDAALNR